MTLLLGGGCQSINRLGAKARVRIDPGSWEINQAVQYPSFLSWNDGGRWSSLQSSPLGIHTKRMEITVGRAGGPIWLVTWTLPTIILTMIARDGSLVGTVVMR